MKTVGIIGSGQLAQLLAHSAYTLGLNTLCYSDTNDCPAARVSPIFVGDLADHDRLKAFAEQVDVITLENENIPEAVLALLETCADVCPGKEALVTSQDRLIEKTAFRELGIATPAFSEVSSLEQLQSAIDIVGLPAILKTRRFGYDGKGQFVIRAPEQSAEAWQAIGEQPAILEQMVNFDEEVSLLAARNQAGQVEYFPLVQNQHVSGILRLSVLNRRSEHPLQEQAEAAIERLMDAVDYVGVMAFEFFVVQGQLIANEIAPRVHNSGHITSDACNVSQFEQHLRAICNLPLAQPQVLHHAAMLNLIGEWPDWAEADLQPGMHVYDYGKSEREGRKLGHINIAVDDAGELERLVSQFSGL